MVQASQAKSPFKMANLTEPFYRLPVLIQLKASARNTNQNLRPQKALFGRFFAPFVLFVPFHV
jgi:hypothetical protein